MDIDKFCRLLSDFMDGELENGICDEMKVRMQDDSCCESLYNTFSRTLDMCHEIQPVELPEDIHSELCGFLRERLAEGGYITRTVIESRTVIKIETKHNATEDIEDLLDDFFNDDFFGRGLLDEEDEEEE